MGETIEFVGGRRARLGESPVWDPDLKALFWVDTVGAEIVRHDLETGVERAFPTPGPVGCVVLGEPGSLVAGVGDRVLRLDLETGAFEEAFRVEDQPPQVRLNDGKTDRQGRLLIGSLGSLPDGSAAGRLHRFGPGGIEVLRSQVGVSNSLCFSPSGDAFYFADSVRRLLWRFDYDADTGALGERRVLIDTAAFHSAPDGATVDADGDLWVALVEVARIARFAPDGRLKGLVETPIPFPSCPTFGGEDLDRLFVTTFGRTGGRFTSDHPEGGRTLSISGLGVRGVPEARCRLGGALHHIREPAGSPPTQEAHTGSPPYGGDQDGGGRPA